MEDDGQAFVYQRFIAPGSGNIQLAKSLNRSVTGSMNELIRVAQVCLQDGNTSPYQVGFRLNDVLLSALASGNAPYGKPNEAFKKLADECR